jgi:hypothetical protein
MSATESVERDPDGSRAVESALAVAAAAAAARRYLLSIQHEDGHWCGELEGDTILESEYMLTLHFLGRARETRFRKAAEYLRRQELPAGGWAVYPGGPPEVSASAKAYFALKLAGDDAAAPHMAKARAVIQELGGLDAATPSKIYLRSSGNDWEVPTVRRASGALPTLVSDFQCRPGRVRSSPCIIRPTGRRPYRTRVDREWTPPACRRRSAVPVLARTALGRFSPASTWVPKQRSPAHPPCRRSPGPGRILERRGERRPRRDCRSSTRRRPQRRGYPIPVGASRELR